MLTLSPALSRRPGDVFNHGITIFTVCGEKP
jgi:hypothetical protein